MLEKRRNFRAFFTPAARAAAKEARRRRQETRGALDRPDVFVLRDDDAHKQFRWEIRRYGGVVLRQSDLSFATVIAARDAGRRAIAASH